MNDLANVLFTGIGATVFMDLWGIAREFLLGIPRPDYGLVGRWLAHAAHGQFRHDAVARATLVRGERWLGWAAHYVVGIAFAGLLVALAGRMWLEQPTLAPAIAVGLGTVVAPFLVMQPGMGAGIAASRTPRPWQARVQTLLTHTIFGVGLYLSALAVQRLSSP